MFLSSTAHAVCKLISEVTKNQNNNNKFIDIFIDLAKAFDTVPHGKLVQTLNHYGVEGVVLGIFESYFENREQYLKLNEH